MNLIRISEQNKLGQKLMKHNIIGVFSTVMKKKNASFGAHNFDHLLSENASRALQDGLINYSSYQIITIKTKQASKIREISVTKKGDKE